MGIACFAAGIGLLIGMVAGAAVVRAAVALANRLIGPVKPPARDPVEDWDWDAEPEEERPRRKSESRAIPEPGVGKGMMIASASNVLTAFVGFVLGAMAEELEPGAMDDGWGALALAVCTLPFGFAALALLLVPMLPTTLLRAAQVSFLYHVIGSLILLAVGGAIFAAWHMAGG